MSRIASSGRRVRTSSTASSPRPVSPAISYPSSSSSSRRSSRMIASSSAMTTRVRGDSGSATGRSPSASRQLGRDSIEELVLLPFELLDRLAERVAMAREGVGVAARIASFDIGDRGLGDECAQTDVVGFLLEEDELLLGDRELGANALEPFADVDEAPLQDRLRHRPPVYDEASAPRRVI